MSILDNFEYKKEDRISIQNDSEKNKKDLYDEGFPLDNDPELLEFLSLLENNDCSLLIGNNNNSVGIKRRSGRHSCDDLEVLNKILFTGRVVPFLVWLLSDGEWSCHRLKWFVGIKKKDR